MNLIRDLDVKIGRRCASLTTTLLSYVVASAFLLPHALRIDLVGLVGSAQSIDILCILLSSSGLFQLSENFPLSGGQFLSVTTFCLLVYISNILLGSVCGVKDRLLVQIIT